MILHIPRLLTPDQVRQCDEALNAAAWADGRVTAGDQSSLAKRNLQLAEDAPESKALGELILKALAANALFMSAALPLKVYPPLFNRYAEGMGFGDHIDNAIRTSPVTGARYRTDLSCTLFLSDPDEYEGGELVVDERLVKLPAGDMVLYPAGRVHSVRPVTRGERRASFFWRNPWWPTRGSGTCCTVWTRRWRRPAPTWATPIPPPSPWSASIITSSAFGLRFRDHADKLSRARLTACEAVLSAERANGHPAHHSSALEG